MHIADDEERAGSCRGLRGRGGGRRVDGHLERVAAVDDRQIALGGRVRLGVRLLGGRRALALLGVGTYGPDSWTYAGTRKSRSVAVRSTSGP